MNKIKLQEINKNKGITLVALVITIVIVIILAVVAINFAFGESSLVTKANEAKIMQAVSSVKETIHLEALKNNTGLTIDLSNNSIVDASALLELNPNTKIKLGRNVNLTQESKTALQERFGSNVSF